MCGITGIWNLSGELVERDQLLSMTRSLAHRGPDGEGVYIDGPLGLGHRRLAILDLGHQAAQPMSYGNGRYHITYNGEVYNFLELREELEGKGHRFRTETDTEVILAAYEQWGADCLLRFNGMWALAIWDAQEHTLFLSRDRFGVKPLFYLWDGKRFAFASEMKAFLAVPWFDADLDRGMIASAIRDIDAVETSQLCLFQGLRNLQAGHLLVVRNNGEPRAKRWWRTADHLVKAPSRFEEQGEVFRELFLDAVRVRMRSDVPVACSVSGGLDSSSVLCAMSATRERGASGERQAASWQTAFFSWYPGTVNDEREYAEAAIHRAGSHARIFEMDPEAVPGMLDELIFQCEEIQSPHPGPWLLYREMRRAGIPVSLEGHGGDELMAGYPHHVIFARERALGAIPHPLEAVRLSAILRGLAEGGCGRPTFRDVAVVGRLLMRPFRKSRTSSSAGQGNVPLAPERPDGERMHQKNVSLWLRTPPRSDLPELVSVDETVLLAPLTGLLYQDFHNCALRTILRDFDRYSMAHGIEIRCPLLDWRLVCFGFSLPPSSVLGGGYTKRVLREAMKGILPEKVRTRTLKRGYKAPIGDWWHGSLREFVRDTVSSSSFLQSDIWDGPGIRDLVESAQPGEWFAGALPLFRFVVAHRLIEMFRQGRARRLAEVDG